MKPRARQLRLALVCARCVPGEIELNLANHERWIHRAVEAGVDFVGFPECSLTGYELKAEHAVPLANAAVQRLGALARRFRCHLAAGLIERRGVHFFNTHVLFGPQGQVDVTRKINLTRNESRFFRCGNQLAVFQVRDCKLGIAICADATYFETIRVLAWQGAEVIFSPHATYLKGTPGSWISWRMERWSPYARDTVCALAGCNNAGLGTSRDFAGGALAIDHTGAMAARSRPVVNRETMLRVDLDLADLPGRRRQSVFYQEFQARRFYSNKMLRVARGPCRIKTS